MAAQERARAAEHRVAAHEQLAEADQGDGRASERADVERLLAEIAETTARADDERAAAQDELADADGEKEGHPRLAARERARAAEERARAHDQEAEAQASEHGLATERHRSLAAAATERARSREQRAQAAQARAAADAGADDGSVIERARADMHDAWAALHAQRARVHEAESESDGDGAALPAVWLRCSKSGRRRPPKSSTRPVIAPRPGANAVRRTRRRKPAGAGTRTPRARRLRTAPGRWSRAAVSVSAPACTGTAPARAASPRHAAGPSQPRTAHGTLGNEIGAIERALDEHGPTERRALAQMVGSRYWGPGVFGAALHQAVADGVVCRVSRSTFALVGGGHDQPQEPDTPRTDRS